MPTKRRRRAQDRREGFTAGQREHLLLGTDLIQKGYGRGESFERFDEETARADWEDHRDELIAFWLQDPVTWARENKSGFGNPAPGGPGTRPWAWWAWDSPDDPRRVLGLAPIDESARRVMGVLYRRHVLLEAEAAYLRRHDLFFPLGGHPKPASRGRLKAGQ